MTDQELIQELRDKAAVEGHGSIRRLLELAARRIEELDRWTPVSERLPEESNCYLCILSGWDLEILAYDAGSQEWSRYGDFVRWWMALPELPELPPV